jgi:activator of 2-hydroxyglutaryl-CoA dehydratase
MQFALQVISSLSRGYEVVPKLFFCGAPFAFFTRIKIKHFLKILQYDESEIITCELPELVLHMELLYRFPKSNLLINYGIKEIVSELLHENISLLSDLPALFDSQEEFESRRQKICTHTIQKVSYNPQKDKLFMGVDSGSTTTKIVIINQDNEIIYDYYAKNLGDSIGSFAKGMQKFSESLGDSEINFVSSSVIGYGENLLKTAFILHHVIVETMAHYNEAQHINPNVSFILDIGRTRYESHFVEKWFYSKY